ncbi:D-alanyl-D-alanine carboxypeptidase (plasmid) [Paracoccus liaowanqingii]|uniref:D-alanyl-D-alanine carboxypeptidase n=2 Tax=Paracoccus liaowanqingii TaxID=2560053 RepID=A0A4Y5SSA6_9RHOB|nr:D-alanyl-D-alanine carboxypeptidase [Paracoccus liaowanqingii]
MDARTGEAIYQQNANTRLHPASLTKMMTLYMTFSAIERGEVRLDSKFTISRKAANEPPSKLGLRAGQEIELRYLIRAAAVKSANDVATALGENLAGSEEEFTRQMTQMARALGMNNTQFRNAHGLTSKGHYSTAQDMSLLGRHLFYDFPQYYNLFSRRSADASIARVAATNRRFLDDYDGADGIKTGYTRAAGFNLTASAQRGNKRLIATVFGGTSTAQRNQTVAKLLDDNFPRIPDRVRETPPQAPQVRTVSRRANVTASAAATRPEPHRMVLQASRAPTARPAGLAGAPEGDAPSRADRLALDNSPRPDSRADLGTSAPNATSATDIRAKGHPSALALGASSRPGVNPRAQSPILASANDGDG